MSVSPEVFLVVNKRAVLGYYKGRKMLTDSVGLFAKAVNCLVLIYKTHMSSTEASDQLPTPLDNKKAHFQNWTIY